MNLVFMLKIPTIIGWMEFGLLVKAHTSIDLPAVQPDLSPRPRKWAYGSHPDHRRREVAGESGRVAAVLPHQRVLRTVVEELLVGMQEPLPHQQILVVLVVEGGGALHVQRRQGCVAAGGRAAHPAERREGGIHVGVVVDVRSEGGAAGLADGVRAGKRGHVARAQALGGEGGDKLGEAGSRGGEVAIRRALARRGGVPPPQLHSPCRPTKLRHIDNFDRSVLILL